MIYQYFNKLFYYFKNDRTAFIKFSAMSLIAAIVELVGIALVYPFIIKILENKPCDSLFTSPIFLGCAIVILFLLKNVFMIFYTYVQSNFTCMIEAKIKTQFIKYFLCSDFINVSKISLEQKNKIFNFIIPQVVSNFVFRGLNLTINIFILVIISVFVALKFPLAATISAICSLLFIGVQNKLYKPFLTKISKKVSNLSLLREKSYNEIVLNIKSLKVSNNEQFFFDKFKTDLYNWSNCYKNFIFFNSAPPYIVEPFIIVLLFVMIIIISAQKYQTPDVLVASFGTIIAAMFRLAPVISRIQVNYNGINLALPVVKEFLDLYNEYDIDNVQELTKKDFATFEKSIKLENANFGYSKDKIILENINLEIKKGEYIGIAGASGIGKTTLIDIISGLYKIQSGRFLVDDKEYNLPLKIGYIPQEFCVLSSSIRENVAFGYDKIDDNKVIESLKKAQLYDFITEKYKDGIYANPFEGAGNLSVGQKQRIAIARALYSEPDILILDEATSALDIKTEDEICNVLNKLKGKTTIIVIAHRLLTIKSADRIFYFDDKNNLINGTFNELSEKVPMFKNLIKTMNS